MKGHIWRLFAPVNDFFRKLSNSTMAGRTEVAASPSLRDPAEAGPNAKVEGFRKTAPRLRAAPSRAYLVGNVPAFKALVKLFFKDVSGLEPEGTGRRRRGADLGKVPPGGNPPNRGPVKKHSLSRWGDSQLRRDGNRLPCSIALAGDVGGRAPPVVRVEPFEALSGEGKGRPFDKLRANGLGDSIRSNRRPHALWM